MNNPISNAADRASVLIDSAKQTAEDAIKSAIADFRAKQASKQK